MTFQFEFDGRPVEARTGQTIAGALVAANVATLRVTRLTGRPRGIFCGMGICFDCIVSVDGTPNVRACITAVKPGMRVQSRPSDEG